MHEAALAQAAAPETTIILGLLVRKYSLAHELFLIHENNSLLLSDAVVSQEHCRRAAWICSSTWRELNTEHDRFSTPIKRAFWEMRTRWSDIDGAVAKLRAHRKKGDAQFPHSEIPRPVDKNSGTMRQAGSPYLLRLHQFLVMHYRLSIEQAWDFSFAEATMRWQCYYEEKGGIDVANQHDASFKEYIEKREREKKEEREKKGAK